MTREYGYECAFNLMGKENKLAIILLNNKLIRNKSIKERGLEYVYKSTSLYPEYL